MVKLVEPKVFKIAETRLCTEFVNQITDAMSSIAPEARRWLDGRILAHDSDNYASPVLVNHAEILIETAGRICYKSFAPGLNPNVTMIRDRPKDYFANILKAGDGSILEHASVTFLILGGSRVFTHELVRHRVGVAYSQESLRYVRPRELPMTVVPGTSMGDNLEEFKTIEGEYRHLADAISWETINFDTKKSLTSLLRRILPQGMATDIVFTANHRTLRWLIEARTHPSAEVEIRFIFDQIAEILLNDYPLIYQDFERSKNPDGTTTYKPTLRSKV